MQILILVLNFVLASLVSPEFQTHKFYVSTTEVELKKENKTLQVTAQFFTDDLEFLLRKNDNSIKLDPDSNQKQIDSLLTEELKNKLQFSSKNTVFEFTFLGKEYRNDVSLCYIEIPLEEIPEKLNIKNIFFFNIFEDQQNIIHFKSQGIRKSFLLHSDKETVTIELNK